ncbi:MAG: hypothetical protein ABI743_08570, partial [bacterium]
MRRRTVLVLGLLTLAIALYSFGCQSPAQAKRAEHLTVFFSNDVENELFPGGRSHSMGGLARRASIIGNAHAGATLVVDTGNFSAH